MFSKFKQRLNPAPEVGTAPAGAPPSRRHQEEQYGPPPGPPPSHKPSYTEQPLPSTGQEPPPYHDWQSAVPDTSLLPPPPSLSYEESPTANASGASSDRAGDWCRANPLWAPRPLTSQQQERIHMGALDWVKSDAFAGKLSPHSPKHGVWIGSTKTWCQDANVHTDLPIYAALYDSPLTSGVPKTIYFEVKMLGTSGGAGVSMEEADVGLALGYFAPPYPGFRMPGWQRGSLAVHGDDGRRYVNNTFGGMDFVNAFQVGEVLGIGMKFNFPSRPPSYLQQPYGGGGSSSLQPNNSLDIEIFFTRDGVREAGWDLHEQLDERSEGGVKGLEGDFDIFPCVGVFGAVDFEIRLKQEDWVYKEKK